jgi:hypothetical protein
MVGSDMPYPAAGVDVTFRVDRPKSWGELSGTVTGVTCAGTTTALPGATVQVTEPNGTHHTLATDETGRYGLWLDARKPLQVIAARDGYQPQTSTIRITAGQSTERNFALESAQCR